MGLSARAEPFVMFVLNNVYFICLWFMKYILSILPMTGGIFQILLECYFSISISFIKWKHTQTHWRTSHFSGKCGIHMEIGKKQQKPLLFAVTCDVTCTSTHVTQDLVGHDCFSLAKIPQTTKNNTQQARMTTAITLMV